MHFISTEAALSGPSRANIVLFKSSKISRVVKSSLAAEGNVLCAAADEQLYLRLLCEALRFCPPSMTNEWKESLKVPGTLVTDAQALYDHLLRTAMIDILAAKQLIESALMGIAWVHGSPLFINLRTH